MTKKETIQKIAKKVIHKVDSKQKLPKFKKYSQSEAGYLLCKYVLDPNKHKYRKIKKPADSKGKHISHTIKQKNYLKIAKAIVDYCEIKGRFPNNVTIGDYVIEPKVIVYAMAGIVNYHSKHNKLPVNWNFNSKAFISPTEDKNSVFQLWVKTFGFTPKYLDDVCEYIMKVFGYEFYFDDKKSNAQVIKDKSGNCTDLLQMLVNMAEALGYEWKIIHTKCRVSGTGHVYGKFRKKGTSDWFIRDIACIADNGNYCVWCNVDEGKGYKLAENPSWFLANLRR